MKTEIDLGSRPLNHDMTQLNFIANAVGINQRGALQPTKPPSLITTHYNFHQNEEAPATFPNWRNYVPSPPRQTFSNSNISCNFNKSPVGIMNCNPNLSPPKFGQMLGTIQYQRHPTPNGLSKSLTDFQSNRSGSNITKQIFKDMKLRKGKWTMEEEKYANLLISEFETGIVSDCENGITLRAFLSRKLHCAPMRISKKFAGKNCIGKHVFFARNRPGSPSQKVSKSKLAELEQTFYRSLLQENPENSIPAATVMALHNSLRESMYNSSNDYNLLQTYHQFPTESFMMPTNSTNYPNNNFTANMSNGVSSNHQYQHQNFNNEVKFDHQHQIPHNITNFGVDTSTPSICPNREDEKTGLCAKYNTEKYDHVAVINKLISFKAKKRAADSNFCPKEGANPGEIFPGSDYPEHKRKKVHHNPILHSASTIAEERKVQDEDSQFTSFSQPESSNKGISADAYASLSHQLVLAVGEHSAYCCTDKLVPGGIENLDSIRYQPNRIAGAETSHSRLKLPYNDAVCLAADDNSAVTARVTNTKSARIASLLQSSKYPGNLLEVSLSVTKAKRALAQCKKTDSRTQKCRLSQYLNVESSSLQSDVNGDVAVVSGSERSGSDCESVSAVGSDSLTGSSLDV